MAALILAVLMIAGTDVNNAEHDDVSKRQNKRQLQNTLAARKSYEAKKRERERLLQKNTELMEVQKKLILDKSRLEKNVIFLKQVLNNIDHKSCSATTARDTEYLTFVSRTFVSAHSLNDYDDDNNEALDLSVRSRLPVSYESESSKQTPKGRTSLKSVVFENRSQRDKPAPRNTARKTVRFEEPMQIMKSTEDGCRILQNDTVHDMSRSQQNGDIQEKGKLRQEVYVQDTLNIKQENDIQDIGKTEQKAIQDIGKIKQEYDVQDTCSKKQNGVSEISTINQEDSVFNRKLEGIKCEM